MATTTPQTTSTVGHVPPSEGKKNFPPFDTSTFASQFIWLAITFVILYVLMSKAALPRIGGILEERRGRIEGDLAAAERLKSESDAALAAYEKALSEARARAQAIANDTRDKMAAEAEIRRKALEADLNTKLAAAEQTIATKRTAAMSNVQGIAMQAASAIVERLIGIVPPEADVTKAVSDALKH
jgi:F-type H+-transporting ATPase subunit b